MEANECAHDCECLTYVSKCLNQLRAPSTPTLKTALDRAGHAGQFARGLRRRPHVLRQRHGAGLASVHAGLTMEQTQAHYDVVMAEEEQPESAPMSAFQHA